MPIQTKANEQYFPVVLFIMLYKVVLSFESVDEILKCDHSNVSCWAVLSYGAVYYAVQDGSSFDSGNVILKCTPPNESTEQYFPLKIVYYTVRYGSNFKV